MQNEPLLKSVMHGSSADFTKPCHNTVTTSEDTPKSEVKMEPNKKHFASQHWYRLKGDLPRNDPHFAGLESTRRLVDVPFRTYILPSLSYPHMRCEKGHRSVGLRATSKVLARDRARKKRRRKTTAVKQNKYESVSTSPNYRLMRAPTDTGRRPQHYPGRSLP